MPFQAFEIVRAMMFKAEEWGWRERDLRESRILFAKQIPSIV